MLLASSMRWSKVCGMFVAAVAAVVGGVGGGGVGGFFLVMVRISISISNLKNTGEIQKIQTVEFVPSIGCVESWKPTGWKGLNLIVDVSI